MPVAYKFLAHRYRSAVHTPQIIMLPEAQKIIDDGLRGIVQKVLKQSPWDPSFGLTPDTGPADVEFAVELFDAIVDTAIAFRKDQTCLRKTFNRGVSRINQLPPELLSIIWKQALPITIDYHASLKKIRRACTYWADLMRNDPSLWTVVQCSDSLDLVKISLERSKSLPLHIRFPCIDVSSSDDEPEHKDSDDDDEEEEEEGKGKHHESHSDLLQILEKHIPTRGVSQLHFKPYEADWNDLSAIVAAPAPFLLTLTVKYQRATEYTVDKSTINMRGLDLCGGVAPSLQLMDLTFCDLPAKYPPLPSLLSCTIRRCTLSLDDLVHIITLAPALKHLSVSYCTALNSGESPPPTTRIRTGIRSLHVEYNEVMASVQDAGGLSLARALEYFEAPDLGSFNVLVDRSERDFEVSRILHWISDFTRTHCDKVDTLTIGRREHGWAGASLISMEFKSNFFVGILHTSWSPDTQESLMTKLINAIDRSCYPSVTSLELRLARPCPTIFLPLVTKFSSVTELFFDHNAPESWSFLGRKNYSGEWPLPHLKTIRIQNGPGDQLSDMLRARSGEGGLDIISVVRVGKTLGWGV